MGVLTNGAVRLINKDWLIKSYVVGEVPLVRRQDLPDGALMPGASRDRESHGIVSHGWLAPGHLDPDGIRRADVRRLALFLWLGLFWDFLSLYQVSRDEEQEQLFRMALSTMHLIYGNLRWIIFR